MTDHPAEGKREEIARAIYAVSCRWIAPNFPEGHKLQTFDELGDRERRLNLEYADAALALLSQGGNAAEPAAWLVGWHRANGDAGLKAYVNEDDARKAAKNLEAYSASETMIDVQPLYAAPTPSPAESAAVAAERERCAKLCDIWVARYGSGDIQYITPTEFASDAVKDIADAIRRGVNAPVLPREEQA